MHFERPCNKLQNVTSKLKILKSKLENLKKFKIRRLKGTVEFCFKMKLNFEIFRFTFSLSNRKTNFKSEFRFSIKIEK